MLKNLISIIIPVFNQKGILVETIRSIKEQSYTNFECLLVDDESDEFTRRILVQICIQDSRFIYYPRPKKLKKGGNSCRNYGFKMAKGEFIQWFDADDIMHSNKLQNKLEVLKNNILDFVLCEGTIFQGSINNVLGYWNDLSSENPLLDHAFGKLNIQTNSPLFRKSYLNEKKLFNVHLKRKQEYEFFSRILLENPKYVILPQSLFFYRIHENSINGRNDTKTMISRVEADYLVYNNLSKSKVFNRLRFIIQDHFFLKVYDKIKWSIRKKRLKCIFYSAFVLLRIFSISYLIKKVQVKYLNRVVNESY